MSQPSPEVRLPENTDWEAAKARVIARWRGARFTDNRGVGVIIADSCEIGNSNVAVSYGDEAEELAWLDAASRLPAEAGALGCLLSDEVSNEFLMYLPEEARLKMLCLTEPVESRQDIREQAISIRYTDLLTWLEERKTNCIRLGKSRSVQDTKGWLEDAAYFEQAIAGIKGVLGTPPSGRQGIPKEFLEKLLPILEEEQQVREVSVLPEPCNEVEEKALEEISWAVDSTRALLADPTSSGRQDKWVSEGGESK